jgi:uncharacterized membrane protein YeiH
MTGVGGGTIRDVLVREVPGIFLKEIYVIPALLATCIIVAGDLLRLPPTPTAIVAVVLYSCLRIMSLRLNWSLPRARRG